MHLYVGQINTNKISQNKYLIADLITGKFIRKRIVNHI